MGAQVGVLQSVPLCCMAAASLGDRGSKMELELCMSTALACRLQGLGNTFGCGSWTPHDISGPLIASQSANQHVFSFFH